MATKKKPSQDTFEGYTPLEQYCIGLSEFYKALRKAGFPSDMAFGIILERSAYPDWLLPVPIDFDPNNPDHMPYEDDEE